MLGHKYWLVVTMLIWGGLTQPALADQVDPTRPPVQEHELTEENDNSAELPELLVSSVMYRKTGGSHAIINGERFQVGDEINEWQVWAIESNRVILERAGDVVLLSVFAAPERSTLKDIQ